MSRVHAMRNGTDGTERRASRPHQHWESRALVERDAIMKNVTAADGRQCRRADQDQTEDQKDAPARQLAAVAHVA